MDNLIISQRHRHDETFLRYLAFGIVGGYERVKESVEWLSASRAEALKHFENTSKPLPFAESKEILLNLLNDIVLENVRAVKKDGFVTLGLTSGFDSRPILMILRANKAPVHTYTFGERGLLDFDLVKLLCKKTGFENSFFDTNTLGWDLSLYQENITQFLDYPISPRVVVNEKLSKVFPKRYEFQGYFNGQLTTAKDSFSGDWSKAIQTFSTSNDTFRMQSLLGREVGRSLLPSSPFVDDQVLHFEHQLALAYRLEQRIRPISNENVTYLLPYTDPRWVGFWLTRPVSDILNQRLWLSTLASLKNELFFDLRRGSVRTRSSVRNYQIRLTYGWAWSQRKYRKLHQKLRIEPKTPQSPTEHFDLFTAYSNNSSFRTFVHEAISRLRGRNIFSSNFVDEVLYKFKHGDWRARKTINGLVSTDILLEAGILRS